MRYNSIVTNTIKQLVAGLASVAAATAVLVNVSPASAQPSYAMREESVGGVVRSFDRPYDLYVRDNRGYVDHVLLHQGTIINPTGITLYGGMRVTVYGRAEGSVFAADEIDTPYRYRPPMYYYPYGYSPYGGYPWGWGVGFGWGWRPWRW